MPIDILNTIDLHYFQQFAVLKYHTGLITYYLLLYQTVQLYYIQFSTLYAILNLDKTIIILYC